MHLFIWFNSPCSLQMSLVSKYLPRTPGLRENLQTARKDFVTRSDLLKSRTKKCFEAPSLVCRRWFHPVLPKLRDESPPGWLEQRPRWLWLGGRAGLCSTRAPLCSPFPGNFRERPSPPARSVPSALALPAFAVPCPGRGAGSAGGSEVASARHLVTQRGEAPAGQGRLLRYGVTGGGCRQMKWLGKGSGRGAGAAAPGRFLRWKKCRGLAWLEMERQGWGGWSPHLCPPCTALSFVPRRSQGGTEGCQHLSPKPISAGTLTCSAYLCSYLCL